jgi:hypothetical protein
MKIDFTVPFRRIQTARTLLAEPAPEPQGRAPRIARLVALAHKLDAMVRSGEIRDYAQLARLGHVSPARLTQIMAVRPDRGINVMTRRLPPKRKLSK